MAAITRKVSLIRHGVTERNLAGALSGMGTEGITAEARRELEAAAFDARGFDAVYCSPAVRCLETAQALGLTELVTDRRLAERDFGVFEGLTAAESRARYPMEFEAFARLDGGYSIPDGESRADHLARVMSWLRDLGASSSVLAVTHGGTVDFLYRLGSGLDPHGGTLGSCRAPRGRDRRRGERSRRRADRVRQAAPLAPKEGRRH